MGIFGLMAYWINEVCDHLKTQETCIGVVKKYPWIFECVTDHLKTQEMCDKAVDHNQWQLEYVPNHFKTQ